MGGIVNVSAFHPVKSPLSKPPLMIRGAASAAPLPSSVKRQPDKNNRIRFPLLKIWNPIHPTTVAIRDSSKEIV
jgi:hypothetical protein